MPVIVPSCASARCWRQANRFDDFLGNKALYRRLRFYLDEPEAEIARIMGIRQSTVRSTAHRALIALGHELGATP